MLKFILRGSILKTRVTAAVAYAQQQKTRPEPIAGSTDFEVMMGMGKVGIEVLGSKS